jgi:hypothetical protein
MNIQLVEFKVTGTAPLLMANPHQMVKDGGGSKVKPKVVAKDDYEGQADLSEYRDENGDYYLPCMAFRRCMLAGTKQMKIGRSSAASVAMSSVFTGAPRVVLLNPKTGKPLKRHDGVTDTQRGVNPSTGQGIIIARRRFEEWAAIVPFKIDHEIIPSPDTVNDWLTRGGTRAGVGAYRIELGGEYGRFESVLKNS